MKAGFGQSYENKGCVLFTDWHNCIRFHCCVAEWTPSNISLAKPSDNHFPVSRRTSGNRRFH